DLFACGRLVGPSQPARIACGGPHNTRSQHESDQRQDLPIGHPSSLLGIGVVWSPPIGAGQKLKNTSKSIPARSTRRNGCRRLMAEASEKVALNRRSRDR